MSRTSRRMRQAPLAQALRWPAAAARAHQGPLARPTPPHPPLPIRPAPPRRETYSEEHVRRLGMYRPRRDYLRARANTLCSKAHPQPCPYGCRTCHFCRQAHGRGRPAGQCGEKLAGTGGRRRAAGSGRVGRSAAPQPAACATLAAPARPCRQRTTEIKTSCSQCEGQNNFYGGPGRGAWCGSCLWIRIGALKAQRAAHSPWRTACSAQRSCC